MARRISRKELKRDEFVEATAEATNWIEEHWADVVKWTVAALIVAVAILAWVQWTRSTNAAAGVRLSVAIESYQKLETAGFADAEGLDEVAATFAEIADGSTPSAPAARFYAGAAAFRLGRHDEAISQLEPIASDGSTPSTLRAAARAMLIEALASAGQTDRARSEIEALIAEADPLLPPSAARLQMSAVRERSGDEAAARAALQRLVDEFPDTAEAREARERLDS